MGGAGSGPGLGPGAPRADTVEAAGAPLLRGRCEGLGKREAAGRGSGSSSSKRRPGPRRAGSSPRCAAHLREKVPRPDGSRDRGRSRWGREVAGNWGAPSLGHSPPDRREEGGIYEMSISFLIKKQPRVFLIACHSDACEQARPALATLGNSVPGAGCPGQPIGLGQESPRDGRTDGRWTQLSAGRGASAPLLPTGS